VAPGVLVAASSVVGVWLAWRVFVDTWAGQRVERATLQGARYGQNRLWHVAEPILSVVSIWFIIVVVLAAVLVAVLRRRWMLAAQVAVLMAGANLTTRVLKVGLIDRPDLGIAGPGFNTLPSGHTTAAASVAAVVVLVVPPRVRPWAAGFGALYTAATGVSTLVGQWHRPSDVIAAILVVLGWSGVAARADRRSSGMRTGSVLLALVALVALVPATLTLHRSWTAAGPLDSRSELLTAYAGGACGVVAASALGFAILLVLRHVTTARVGAA
jgi:membrane-associated phospholipid phosphatase